MYTNVPVRECVRKMCVPMFGVVTGREGGREGDRDQERDGEMKPAVSQKALQHRTCRM